VNLEELLVDFSRGVRDPGLKFQKKDEKTSRKRGTISRVKQRMGPLEGTAALVKTIEQINEKRTRRMTERVTFKNTNVR